MSTYRVTMVDKTYYEIDIEAANADEATEMALNSVEKAKVISEPYIEVIEIEEVM